MNLNKILEFGREKNVSDIHISPNIPIYFRLNGQLFPAGDPLKDAEIQNVAMEILTEQQQQILDEKRHIDFVYSTIESKTRFRGNAYYTREGLVMAMRMIPAEIPPYENLGLPQFILDEIMQNHHGMILVVGATGHGKSTTLASIINHRAKNKAEHIIMLEDPIEFLVNSQIGAVHQRSFGRDVNNFADGLKAALREDPDVLMVGEMRDLETISAALTAAETGHLVFSTLHTNDAPETINRIIDAFPTDQQEQVKTQLASTLSMVIAQRLLPTKDGQSRVLAYEVMTMSYAIQTHIRKGTTYQIHNAMQTDSTGRMVLFDQSLAALVLNNTISAQVAFENTHSKDQLKYILELHGYKGD